MQYISIKALIFGFFCAVSVSASAQFNLGDLAKRAEEAVTSSGASSVASALTSVFSNSKVATKDKLVGNWSYVEPAIVFSSNNALKNVGGKLVASGIEKSLQTKLAQYGIKKGTLKMTFDNNGNFTQTLGGKTLKGTYTVSGKSVNLLYGGIAKQIAGTTQVDGNDLVIVMDAAKLLSYMKILGVLSGNAALKSVSSLIGSTDGMLCGLRLQK